MGDKKTRTKLLTMVLNAKTVEQVEEVVNSEEFQEASGFEVALCSTVLCFVVLRIRTKQIEDMLAALKKAVDAIGEKL